MNVKRKEKYVPLGDLEPGQRFRFKSEPSPQLLFQVCKVSPRCNWVGWNRDTDGYRSESDGDTLVEHVKGHWQPDEEERLMELGTLAVTTVFQRENDAHYWQVAIRQGNESRPPFVPCNCLITGDRDGLPPSTLVRVVHCTLVEAGAKIEETEE